METIRRYEDSPGFFLCEGFSPSEVINRGVCCVYFRNVIRYILTTYPQTTTVRI